MVAADEVGFEVELGGVRAWMLRSRLLFGGMCITIGECAIGLGAPVHGQSSHTVDAAPVAGNMVGKSVRIGLGSCGKHSKFRSQGLSGPS